MSCASIETRTVPESVAGKGPEGRYKKSTVERYRRWVVWILYAMVFASVLFGQPTPETDHRYEYVEILAYLMVGLATLGRAWCGLYVFGRKNKELCQDGPYSICRNPLYLFTFMGAMGVAVGSGRILLVIAFGLIYCFYYWLVIKFEERRLGKLFGKEFEQYCARVRRFVPGFQNYRSRERIEINPHLVFKRIVKGMWFFWLFTALEVIKSLKGYAS
jgi:protein-S-isoprenylcysteine O-methyltransferase Ste14